MSIRTIILTTIACAGLAACGDTLGEQALGGAAGKADVVDRGGVVVALRAGDPHLRRRIEQRGGVERAG